MNKLFAFAIAVLISFHATAQDVQIWTLQSSIQYALKNNITIQQGAINERLAKLSLQQNQLSQLPGLNVSTGFGRSLGRSVDPTTNQFVSGTNYGFSNLSASADVLVFGWFRKKYSIARDKYNFIASSLDLDQLKDDVSLNIATGYLRILLAQEQVNMNRKQVELSHAQLQQSRRFAEAGRIPDLNVAQLEAQLATDSANLVASIAEYNSSILDIKALLNLDFETTYTPAPLSFNISNNLALHQMSPEDIYTEARKNINSLRSAQMRLFAARKNLQASRASKWPVLTMGAQVGSNYSSTVKNSTITGYRAAPTNYYILDSLAEGNRYPVYQNIPSYTSNTVSFSDQLNRNLRQSVVLNLSIPIFNGWQSQYAIKQAKANMQNEQLNGQQAELKLKQSVYDAYHNAISATEKYKAAVRAEEASGRAFYFAKRRHDLELTNTVEYLLIQNAFYAAQSRLATAKYDLVFKLKVIDYYLGKELSLD